MTNIKGGQKRSTSQVHSINKLCDRHDRPEQNFFASITASQNVARISSRDASFAAEARALDTVDVLFTAVFAAELLVNMFANWFRRFAYDGWNQLDVIVVTLSLVALGPVSMPANVIRVMRAFRVIRLFGRMKSLKDIVGALTASILPVLNALLVLFIVTCICAYSQLPTYSGLYQHQKKFLRSLLNARYP
jgi:hypothetical protein